LRLLVEGLRRAPGVEQVVAAAAGSRLADEVEALGVPLVPLRWRTATDARAAREVARLCRCGLEIVHVHDSHALQLAFFGLALTGGNASLVASRRVDFPVRSPWLWNRTNLVLAVSSAVREALRASGVESRRVRVVHDGVPLHDPRPRRPGLLRRAAHAAPSQPLVGAVGALVPHKDHATLVRAAAHVTRRRPEVRFVVAGEGPERTRLQAMIARLGLEERFALPGYVPDVRLSLTDLDVFAMPSREEGFGSAGLEAMAEGVPVVLSLAGGLRDLSGGALPTVAVGDAEALAREIERLLEDGAARRHAGETGRCRAAAFEARVMVGRTLRAYEALVSGRAE